VITPDLAESWKNGNFGIIEINAAPGIFMHLKPAIGEPVDVTSAILKTFFASGQAARIPILSFNRIAIDDVKELVDRILQAHPDWTVGAVCQQAVLINRSEKQRHADYNTNVQNLLRNPTLDFLIAEYPESVLMQDGMFYDGSDMVVLEDPTPTELMLARDGFDTTTIITKHANTVAIRRQGLVEQYELDDAEPFSRVYLKEIAALL
jgi:cyanophycin synthetase